MAFILLFALFAALAIAGLLGWTVDSRDPDYSLRLTPYDRSESGPRRLG